MWYTREELEWKSIDELREIREKIREDREKKRLIEEITNPVVIPMTSWPIYPYDIHPTYIWDIPPRKNVFWC